MVILYVVLLRHPSAVWGVVFLLSVLNGQQLEELVRGVIFHPVFVLLWHNCVALPWSWWAPCILHIQNAGVGNSTPARQGCLHRFTGAVRRLVTKKPRARGENPPGICEARCLSRLRRALRFSRRVPLARGMSDNESSRCFVRSSSLFLFAGVRPVEEGFPMEGAEYGRLGALGAFEAVRRGFLQPPLSLTTRAPPGAGRDPLEEMFGVRMVDHESLLRFH
ncbi:hypothetical protein PAPYR_7135 [Paratrimastix pyriformis]|uniref:Secreted protein n=1 Tax=Paratrimastix pyriformis TaxID=342808 RepID=A0ABQ8UJH0_9EUKA|nr:hypothetical protein PAPYR_7135 [Paratrimastix pyriformis]